MTRFAFDSVQKIIQANSEDPRIPVIVLLGATLARVHEEVFGQMAQSDLVKIVVFSNENVTENLPNSLVAKVRVVTLSNDELRQVQGCLCCSMRSELAASMRQLFFAILRKEQAAVRAVLVVTRADDANALKQTLKHAPFLGQRFRLVACLPLGDA